MLKRILLIVFLSGSVAFAQPLAPPQQPAQRHQEASGNKDEGEKKPHIESIRQSIAVIWEKTWEDPVAFYTLVLTGFTGLLAGVSIFQGILLLRSDKTARIAAVAAERSARAAIGQKLPILRCRTPHLWPSPDQFHSGSFVGTADPMTDDFIKILQLEFSNHGETIAYPQEYGLGWLFTTREPTEKEILPPEPEYSDIYKINQEVVIEDAFTTPRIVTFCLMPSDQMRAGIRSGAGTLRLCAYLKYLDFLDDSHEVRFCWRWVGVSRDGVAGRLIRDDLAPEAYTRKT